MLTGATLEGGEGADLPDPLEVKFTELTRFDEHVKTNEGLIKREIDPSDLAPGDTVEITMYKLEDDGGVLPTKYWIEKIMRKIDLRD